VNLVIEEPEGIPPVFGDEGKISQILRNFISNALKFTEHGEVRVTARLHSAHEQVIFAVADTGIGIAPQDQEVIFQEFTQLESPLQKKVKGTGLGLPLSRKLAQMLGGRISVESEPGRGSRFSVTIPLTYRPVVAEFSLTVREQDASWAPDPLRTPILVVEDNQETMFLYEKLLKGSGYQIIPARSIREVWEGLKKGPKAVILDILLAGEDTWRLLAQLKGDPLTRGLPVLVVTAVDDSEKGLALGADAYCVKPVERRWLIEHLKRLTGSGQEKILLVDDDDMSRYIVKQILRDTRFTLIEAAGGQDGIELARTERPRSIVLDLVMPGLPGEEVLEILREDVATRDIPVIIFTSKVLSEAERRRLESLSSAIVEKGELSNEKLATTIREKLAPGGSALT
jgi:CheY-like chemotaxis protein